MNLPSFQDEHGTYEIPNEIMEILAKLMALPPDQYLRARMYLAPFAFYFEAARRNDLFPSYFSQLVMKDYNFWHLQLAGALVGDSMKSLPKPPNRKVN
jgi:hypothetical protein